MIPGQAISQRFSCHQFVDKMWPRNTTTTTKSNNKIMRRKWKASKQATTVRSRQKIFHFKPDFDTYDFGMFRLGANFDFENGFLTHT